MEFNGDQLKQLNEALVRAYPTPEDLEYMVETELNVNLAEIASGTNLAMTSFKLIRWAKAQGRLAELVTRASQANPYNPELRAFAKRIWNEDGILIYMKTIREQRFDGKSDHELDWSDHFEGSALVKGHQTRDPNAWNSVVLRDLEKLAAHIDQKTECRLIRVRGFSRLSAWFALGNSFPAHANYTVEVDQNGRLWCTGETGDTVFPLLIGASEGIALDGAGDTVAVGISVTGSLDDDVSKYLANRTEKIASVLFVRPERALGRECFQTQEEVRAFTDGVKEAMRNFVKRWDAKRLLLFYFGPLSGACFLGHQLNAVCREIQIMEDQQPGYAPAVLLKY